MLIAIITILILMIIAPIIIVTWVLKNTKKKEGE